MKYYDKIYDKMLSLTIMPTELCNFRCRYCYEKFEKGKMQEDIYKGIVKYLQKNLSSYSGLDISWFGGEPLLALDIIEKMSTDIYELCKLLKKPYMAGMTTNGYLLTPEVVERLLKYSHSKAETATSPAHFITSKHGATDGTGGPAWR